MSFGSCIVFGPWHLSLFFLEARTMSQFYTLNAIKGWSMPFWFCCQFFELREKCPTLFSLLWVLWFDGSLVSLTCSPRGAVSSYFFQIIKSRVSLLEEMTTYIRNNHPYDVCEVLSTPVGFRVTVDRDAELLCLTTRNLTRAKLGTPPLFFILTLLVDRRSGEFAMGSQSYQNL